MAVSKTTDGAASWTHYILDKTTSDYPLGARTYTIATAPSNSAIVYAGGAVNGSPALFKTTDSGDNWSDVASGLSDTVRALAIDPDNAGVIYAGSRGGVFKSTDAGTSWNNMGLADVRSIVIDPDVSNIVYAGTETGIYISFSGGVEWEAMNDGLDDTDARCLGLLPDVYLFAGTWGSGMYRCVPEYDDVWPPAKPFITQGVKAANDSDVVLTWNTVATDTLDNPETMDYYVVYRNTSPDFIPGASDSIAAVSHPDTEYIDEGALVTGESYYYLVKAVDTVSQRSKKSNMAYVFERVLNENAGATADRNWVAMPYISSYDSVRDVTDDLSLVGTPISKITRLDVTTQDYYSWIYHFVLGWYGNHPTIPNFPIESGVAYEFVANLDAAVVFCGANDPDYAVVLNENPGAVADRNWVALPYNAVYDSVKDITDELAPTGSAITKITRLDEPTQNYYSWIYHFVLGWYGNDPAYPGNNFPIEPGKGYEFIASKDSVWNPTEYSNEAMGQMLVYRRQGRASDLQVIAGDGRGSGRVPVWVVAEPAKRVDYSDARAYVPAAKRTETEVASREPGISHIVSCDLDLEGYDDLVFTVYRPDRPYDVLTERSAGCVVVRQGDTYRLVSFDVGNFRHAWRDGEEVLFIIEALKHGRGYYSVMNFSLDESVDIQELGELVLVPFIEPGAKEQVVKEYGVDRGSIIGYSIYRNDKRLNDQVLERGDYSMERNVYIRPAFRGGYETVYSSQAVHHSSLDSKSLPAVLKVSPNPFTESIVLSYYILRSNEVELQIYDVSGRLVRKVCNEIGNPGHHVSVWDATDDAGKTVPVGIYFVRFATSDCESIKKLILLR